MRIVMKIGGGILRNSRSFDQIVGVLRDRPREEVVCVLSAVYGVTNNLEQLFAASLRSQSAIRSGVAKLERVHTDILMGLGTEGIRSKVEIAVRQKLERLQNWLMAIHYLQEDAPRFRDLVMSFGERLSPIILKGFLEDAGLPVVILDSEQAKIIATGDYGSGTGNFTQTRRNLQSTLIPLLKDNIVLVTGFYGINNEKKVCTFGRGGTDYSAGLIAGAINADKLEIWKDVDGFMSADPKVVRTAKLLSTVSFQEAQELGVLGAKVLHPMTMTHLYGLRTSVSIRNILDPGGVGTVIEESSQRMKSVIKSIASKSVAMVHVETAEMVHATGFAAQLFSRIAESGIEVDMIVTSEASISFTTQPKITQSFKKVFPKRWKIDVIKDLSMLGIVGEGIQGTPGILGRIAGVLGRSRINVLAVSLGGSGKNLSLVIHKADKEKAIRSIHQEFFG